MWSPFRVFLPVAVLIGMCCLAGDVHGGKAQLKNNAVIEGEIVPIRGLTPGQIQRTKGPTESFPMVMIHSGFKRYFVPRLKMDWDRTVQDRKLGGDEFLIVLLDPSENSFASLAERIQNCIEPIQIQGQSHDIGVESVPLMCQSDRIE